MMATTMTMNSNQISRNEALGNGCPSWKLYENPFYYPQPQRQSHLRRLRLPLSARKIACSLRDLTFFRPVMESELDSARSRIVELKAELREERREREKAESVNERLAKEAAEERRRREEAEREIAAGKAEIDRRRREMEEERKMMRVAEVLREERVQMKLADARFLLEEKITELEVSRRTKTELEVSRRNKTECCSSSTERDDPQRAEAALALTPPCKGNIWPGVYRRASPEGENPHIKRGIRGFVEFPRVVRAIGSKRRNWGSKVECQKAQMRILMKQKSSVNYSSNLIIS